jgi:hypothetical protein
LGWCRLGYNWCRRRFAGRLGCWFACDRDGGRWCCGRRGCHRLRYNPVNGFGCNFRHRPLRWRGGLHHGDRRRLRRRRFRRCGRNCRSWCCCGCFEGSALYDQARQRLLCGRARPVHEGRCREERCGIQFTKVAGCDPIDRKCRTRSHGSFRSLADDPSAVSDEILNTQLIALTRFKGCCNLYSALNTTHLTAALSRFNDSRLAVSRSFSTPRAESGRLVPAGLLAHGSNAAPAFPTSSPSRYWPDPVSGISGASSPLTVAGAASALELCTPHRVPYSLADQHNQRRPSPVQFS